MLPRLKIRISVLLPFTAGLIVYLEGPAVAGILFACALIHEGGHLFFIKLCGAKVVRADIEAIGALIIYDDRATGLNADAAIALGGPLFNLTAAVAGIGFFCFYYNVYIFTFIAANLALAFINLLPISGLDGGRALYSVLVKNRPVGKADLAAARVSTAFKLVLLAISGALVVLSGFNTAMTLLFILNLLQIF